MTLVQQLMRLLQLLQLLLMTAVDVGLLLTLMTVDCLMMLRMLQNAVVRLSPCGAAVADAVVVDTDVGVAVAAAADAAAAAAADSPPLAKARLRLIQNVAAAAAAAAAADDSQPRTQCCGPVQAMRVSGRERRRRAQRIRSLNCQACCGYKHRHDCGCEHDGLAQVCPSHCH